MKISLFLKKCLPLGIRKWFDYSNSKFAKFMTAKFGPLAITKVEDVVNDSTTRTIAFCPLCAEAIKVDRRTGIVGVFLYWDDMTPENPEVMIKKRHTLFVSHMGHSYQVGCSNISCASKSIGYRNLFGTLNEIGELQAFTAPFTPKEHSATN